MVFSMDNDEKEDLLRKTPNSRVECKMVQMTKTDSLYGPGRTGQMLVYFAKTSVTSCLRQVRLKNFRSRTKFCQSLPNFKDAVVQPRSRTNFRQA